MQPGTVRASCPACGPVEVKGPDITIRCRVETMRSMYLFQCPGCASWRVKDAGPNVITLLLRNGAQVEHWRHPAELVERPDDSAAPLNEVDLAGFLAALEQLPTAERDPSQAYDDLVGE